MPFDLYRSRVLSSPRVVNTGVEHRSEGPRMLVPWSRVASARAAEIGEPQGVRTIVFDLLVEESDGLVALRFDADPGEDAQRIARGLAAGLGGRARSCLKTLACDGIPIRWYPDLESFEEAEQEGLG